MLCQWNPSAVLEEYSGTGLQCCALDELQSAERRRPGRLCCCCCVPPFGVVVLAILLIEGASLNKRVLLRNPERAFLFCENDHSGGEGLP